MTTYYDADGTEYYEHEIEAQFDDMLGDIYGTVKLFDTYEYDYGRAVKEIDPILYREAFLAYLDSLLQDGQLFESDPTLEDTE